ncbi:hypothetical protein ACH5RR_001719 [Cinchona calisaya]|uniref:Uncharacterized protein n=1 Tax=Cinchona calisaya TaxID=153742 RepID=A0ABD3B501_9GENT
MGGDGNKQQKKSSFSFFSMFKGKSSRRGADNYYNYEMKEESVKAYKVWHSDEDRAGRWVAKPGIDREASDFITSRTERWKSVEAVLKDDHLN